MMGDKDHIENTHYGFKWGFGVIEVTRAMIYRGRRVLLVNTKYRKVEISVSPTGRSVRVWRDGKELT